ncbi:response regulator [Oryzomonas sagensis]|uniref:Response regulator n=1 Tax=Oryzomonas sagensis TaxID=2603857 RepID=A0ABQ6TP94_9BACT|nr:response regulator [Oryzomonas sagensis]KAB0670448.1 response regulator [Oryzomonas sagensis]
MQAGSSTLPARVILIVEDDHISGMILRDMAARKFPGMAVYVAEDGEAGIDFCREHHPDIVVTDINLPGISGVLMAGEIKRLKPDTKFIVLSGCNDTMHLQEFAAIDVQDFLVKPVELKQLFAAIQACIDAL